MLAIWLKNFAHEIQVTTELGRNYRIDAIGRPISAVDRMIFDWSP
jgi:hypothetical protein